MINKIGIIKVNNQSFLHTHISTMIGRSCMIVIGVRTLNLNNHNYSLRSSFNLLPCHGLIFSRSLCGVESAVVQLSADIEFIYNDIYQTCTPAPILRNELEVIQQFIINGIFVLSPLKVKFFKSEHSLYLFLIDTLTDCPDISLGYCNKASSFYAIMPEKKDVLVLMGLSLMLFRLSHGGLPKDGYRMECLLSSFYESLQEMGKVDRLYKIDLNQSLDMITNSMILDKVKPLVGGGKVYKLISSFLELPILNYDRDGNPWLGQGMPPVGEITRVLFNIVLMDIFDRELKKRFPGITFYRYINEVFLATRKNDQVLFDEKDAYKLLKELSLAGNIHSIAPGDDPLQACGMLIYLDNDSQVHICNIHEYKSKQRKKSRMKNQ